MRVYRHELKFLCEERQLCVIENRIRHICRQDAYAGESGAYLVRSLYFDTYDDRCYQENLAGADCRKKYRIRAYNDETDKLRLECKYSRRGMKAKESCAIDGLRCRELAAAGTKAAIEGLGGSPGTGIQEGAASQGRELLDRFLLERRMELLEPKVVVEYERRPYVYGAGNVRITFDRAIRTSPEVGAFPEKSKTGRSILPEGVHILEVKYDEALPGAVRELLTAGQELRRTSFSKYALCRKYGIR